MKARPVLAALLTAGGLLASTLPAAAAGAAPSGHRVGAAPRGSVRAALVKALYAPRYADITVAATVRNVKAQKADPSDTCPTPVLAHREADQAAIATTKAEKLSVAVAQEGVYRTAALAAKAFRLQAAQLRCSSSKGDRVARHVYRSRRGPAVTELVVTGTDASMGANLKGVLVIDLADRVVVVVARVAEDAQEVDLGPERALALRLARLGATRGFPALVRAA